MNVLSAAASTIKLCQDEHNYIGVFFFLDRQLWKLDSADESKGGKFRNKANIWTSRDNWTIIKPLDILTKRKKWSSFQNGLFPIIDYESTTIERNKKIFGYDFDEQIFFTGKRNENKDAMVTITKMSENSFSQIFCAANTVGSIVNFLDINEYYKSKLQGLIWTTIMLPTEKILNKFWNFKDEKGNPIDINCIEMMQTIGVWLSPQAQWIKGEADKEGYFTLTDPDSGNVLSATSSDDPLTIESRLIIYHV